MDSRKRSRWAFVTPAVGLFSGDVSSAGDHGSFRTRCHAGARWLPVKCSQFDTAYILGDPNQSRGNSSTLDQNDVPHRLGRLSVQQHAFVAKK